MRSIIFILAAALAASAQDRPQDPKEAALGAQLVQEIRRRTTAIENPVVQEYIDRIGRKLAGPKVYEFALISDDAGGYTHEPLSLPGGYIFVSAGLIVGAADEAELAGMLAHAMAHVTLPQPQSNGGTIPLVFIGGWQGLGPGGNGSLVPMSALKTQRENETRADVLAVRTLAEAGYDPEALTRYLARIKPGRGTDARLFSVLPDPETRIAAIRQAIEQLPARTYPPTDPDEFGRMQEQVRSTVLPAQDRPRPTLKRQN